jgi:PKD repeat protein
VAHYEHPGSNTAHREVAGIIITGYNVALVRKWGQVAVVAGACVWIPSCHAVLFKSTADPAYNTTAPGATLADSGWQYQGDWIGFLGTPIAPQFFLAAKHIGGSVGDVFVLNGFTYHTVAVTDSPTSDLRLWRVAETFPSYAPLYTAAAESGKSCVVFGRGTQRGTPVIVSGVTNGWQWGASDRVKRWGENVVAAIVNGGSSVGDLLQVNFDRSAGANECHLSVGDSSGALFIQSSGTWRLAGIHYAVDGPFSNAVDGAMFNAALLDKGGLFQSTGGGWTFNSDTAADKPSSFYSTRISANLAWIAGVTNIAPIAPLASFTATPTSGISPLTVMFTDTSTGTLTNRSWNFGDGSTTNTTANILTHTYNSAGTFTVALTVSGPAGSSTIIQTNLVTVTSPAQLSVNPGSLNFGSITVGQAGTLTFTAANTGDALLTGGVTTTGPFAITAGNSLNLLPGQTQTVTVSFTPPAAGVFGSAVVFTTNGGHSTNAVTGIGVAPAQIAVTPTNVNFGYVLTGATAQATLTVTNTGGTTASNGTATVNAPFGIVSGSAFSVPGFGSASVTIRFSPTSAGTFNDTVSLTTANGGSATVAVTGTGAVAPVAAFSGNPTNPTTSTPVAFTDSSTGIITNWSWNFGDGTTGNTQNPMHLYATAGTFSVSLTVSGPVGASTSTRADYIVVRDDLAPSAPAGVMAKTISTSQIDVSWNASVDAGGSGVAGYAVRRDGAPVGSVAGTSFSDSGLPAGVEFCYDVAAFDHAGNTSAWSAVACATTRVSPGTLAGTYYGLIANTNAPAPGNSGFVKITLKTTGAFAGILTLGGVNQKLAGAFAEDGHWSGSVPAASVSLALDLTNDTEQIRGTVSAGTFTSDLLANRAVFGPASPAPPAWVGNFTVILPANTNHPAAFPQGDGYALVTVDAAGNIRARGVLADGARFKQRVPVSKFGTWPLHALLYKKAGWLGGWVTFTNVVGVSDCDGDVNWLRPAGPANALALVGSRYVAPAAGQRVLVLGNSAGNARLILGEGGLPGIATNLLTVDTGNKVSVVTGDSTKLGVVINAKTGQFQGSFAHPVTGRAAKFNGVVLPIQNFGSGFFLGPNQSGYVVFEPAAP